VYGATLGELVTQARRRPPPFFKPPHLVPPERNLAELAHALITDLELLEDPHARGGASKAPVRVQAWTSGPV